MNASVARHPTFLTKVEASTQSVLENYGYKHTGDYHTHPEGHYVHKHLESWIHTNANTGRKSRGQDSSSLKQHLRRLHGTQVSLVLESSVPSDYENTAQHYGYKLEGNKFKHPQGHIIFPLTNIFGGWGHKNTDGKITTGTSNRSLTKHLSRIHDTHASLMIKGNNNMPLKKNLTAMEISAQYEVLGGKLISSILDYAKKKGLAYKHSHYKMSNGEEIHHEHHVSKSGEDLSPHRKAIVARLQHKGYTRTTHVMNVSHPEAAQHIAVFTRHDLPESHAYKHIVLNSEGHMAKDKGKAARLHIKNLKLYHQSSTNPIPFKKTTP